MNIRCYSRDYYMIETYTQNTEYSSIYTYIKRFNIGKFGYYIKQKYHNTRGNSSGKYMYAAKSTKKSDADYSSTNQLAGSRG